MTDHAAALEAARRILAEPDAAHSLRMALKPDHIIIARAFIEQSAEVEKLKSQLPNGMGHCTVLIKECPLGHYWLTATNWVQGDCPTCELARSKKEFITMSKWRNGEANRAERAEVLCDRLAVALRGMVESNATRALAEYDAQRGVQND